MRDLVGKLTCALLILAVPTPSQAQQGTVTGQIVEASTGEPLPDVVVTISETERKATTSQNGRFRLEDVPAGTRVVKAQRKGYRAQGRAVSVPIGGTAEVQLALRPKSSPGQDESSRQEQERRSQGRLAPAGEPERMAIIEGEAYLNYPHRNAGLGIRNPPIKVVATDHEATEMLGHAVVGQQAPRHSFAMRVKVSSTSGSKKIMVHAYYKDGPLPPAMSEPVDVRLSPGEEKRVSNLTVNVVTHPSSSDIDDTDYTSVLRYYYDALSYDDRTEATRKAIERLEGLECWCDAGGSSGQNRRATTENYSIEAEGQEVIARSSEGVEWRYTTERPKAGVSKKTGGVVYVIDGKRYRTGASHAYALSIDTGNLLWKTKIGGYTRAEIVHVGDETLIVGHSSGIYALDVGTGETRWVYDEFNDRATSFTIAAGTLLFLDGQPTSAHEMMGSRSSSTLYAIDLKTGTSRWSKPLLSEPQKRPLSHVRYSVEGEEVVAKNTRLGQTFRLDLQTGEKLTGSGAVKCESERVREIVQSAFGSFAPSEIDPAVTIDLNGDGMKEEFYQQIGTNRLGQIKVIAVSGTAPCSQILSAIVYDSDWKKEVRRLDQMRNGYHLVEIRDLKYAFDGERYVRAK